MILTRSGDKLSTEYGNLDSEVMTTKTVQTIIRILTSRTSFSSVKNKARLLKYNQDCMDRNSTSGKPKIRS
tara:strand:- start:471 stop:683 length:213 start_codon:yes stop_codon:yes gene_type:complete